MSTEQPQPQQQIQIGNANMFVPFADFAILRTTADGFFVDFVQAMGPGGQYQIVSRAGMSLGQARKLLEAMQQHLDPSKRPAQPAAAQQTTTSPAQVGFSVDEAR